MLKSKVPEKPGNKESPKRDTDFPGKGKWKRPPGKLEAGRSGSEHGKSGWLFEGV